jgi:hypothetical protein
VVLPNPAGAETSTSLGSSEAPERTSSVSLGRATSGRRVAGTWSFVPSTATQRTCLTRRMAPALANAQAPATADSKA